jgi:rubrerythrin
VKPPVPGQEGGRLLHGAGQERPTGEREVAAERCEACGTEMYGLHCKLVCPNCGYKRDCSDP